MKRNKVLAIGMLAILVLAAFGCASQAPATIAPVDTRKPQSTTASEARPNWQQDWEKTKAEARKEGTLVVYIAAGPTVMGGLGEAFRKEFGVNIEWVAGLAQEVSMKVITEQRAGLYFGDLVFIGADSVFLLKPAGALGVLDSELVLPEVLDKNAWYGGDLIWAETGPRHTFVAVLDFPQPPVVINTELVKPGEVTGYRDLLNPKWKGKILLYDPTKAGAGASWFSAVVLGIMDLNYVRDLVKQEPVIVADPRQHIEWVARGKYPIAVAGRTEQELEFKNAGAPLEMVSPVEGVHLTASASGVNLLKNAPHPNAAKVFLNWILSKDGSTIASKLIGGQSARVDVPTDFLDPAMVRKPGQKYFNTVSEEYVSKKLEMQKLAEEVFAPLLK